jgi:tripartite-type tricarboxylate transporter receptor subunit TctC
VTARLFGDKWNESWAKGVVVENVTGAGGNLALAQTAKAAPDGYTLVMGGNAALVINPNLMKLGYDPLKDFAYVTQVFIVPNLVVVRSDFPAKTMPELVAMAKAQPDLLVAGHAGVGTSQHLAGELFKSMAGVKMQQVPYRGSTQVLPDLLGGRLNIFFGNISNCLPLVREGKLRAFAVTSKKRSAQIPELPTMEELGFPGFEATAWFGLMAPAGTPEVRSKLESLGLQLVGNAPDEFAGLIAAETAGWAKIIKDAGIAAQ